MPAPAPNADQYKAYMTDVGNIGSRYATAQTFYLSVVSALIGVVSWFAKDAGTFQKYAWGITAFVTLFIALICYIWWHTLDYYGHLFRAKFTVLKNMEGTVLYPLFTDEWAELQKTHPHGLIEHEKYIPLIIGIAALIGAVLSVLKAFGAF